MLKRPGRWLKTVLAICLGCLPALPAGAQQTPEASALMEEIIVTAQRREQAIDDVSLSITAISGEAARALGVDDTRDVAFLATNIDIKGAGMSDANPAITVRGIGMNNFNANNNPSVSVYLDELFLASPAMINLSMLDLGRIELLKGPQGTLYGRNATGGAVNIISAKPTRELDGFVSAGLAEYGAQRLEAALGGPLSEQLAGRISALYDNQDKSFHRYNQADGSLGNFEDSQTTALRGQLAGEFDQLSFNLGLSYLDQDIANNPFTAVGGYWNSPDEAFVTPCQGAIDRCVNTLGLNLSDADGNPFTHDFQESRVGEMRIQSDVTVANLKLGYEFDAFTLTSITGYVRQERDFGENIWSSPLESFAVVHDEEIEQFSQEIRLAGDAGPVGWIAGLYYWNDTFASDNLANSADILGLLAGVNPIVWRNDQETDAFAAFASLDWRLDDRWTLVTGIRYSDEKTEFAGGTDGTIVDSAAFDAFVGAALGLPNGITIPFTFLDDSTSDSSIDFRAALEFRPNEAILAYGAAASGFKSGGFFGDFTFDNSELDPFDPEQVLAYELGLKATLADGRAQLNWAVFYYDYQDIQTFVPSVVGFKLDNLEQAEVLGAELELLASPMEGLDLRLGFGLLGTEVDSQFEDFDGKDLPNAPDAQLTGTARYQFPISAALNLAFQIDAKHTGAMFRESTNNPWMKTGSYALLNGRISVLSSDGAWELAAWGRNLADEEHEQERFASDIIGMVIALYGSPRQFGLTFNYNL